MSGARHFILWVLLGLGVALFVANGRRYWGENSLQRLSYNEFRRLVEQGEVAEVEFRQEFQEIVGRTKKEVMFLAEGTGSPQLADWIHETSPQTVIHIRHAPFLERWSSLSWVLATMLVLGMLWLFMSRQGNPNQQAFSFGQSRVRRFDETMPRKTFADVAGADEAKEELAEIVDFLKHGEKYRRLGAEVPKGVLLLGPPGCGKTLLARAVAGEANVPFFHISGSDFVELFVGVGAARVRDLFAKAKAAKPCIVFIDEIDAVGRHRGAGLGGGHDEREQTLNQLLVEMDGFEPNTGIVVIAATNRPDILDPALLRPGRFDRRVVVDVPDYKGRKEILELYLRNKPKAPDVDIEILARQTPGFTGADLANLVNEAAILAARNNKQAIGMADLQEAIERVLAGPERRSRLISEEEKRLVAYHEAGHAIVSRLLRHGMKVQKITILPRGLSLGYVMKLPPSDQHIVTESALMDQITATLGGRAAEEVFFNERTTGARQDLEQVTEMARAMVCEYGMSEVAGPRTLGRRHGPIFLGRDIYEDRNYSEEMAKAIDEEIRRIIEEAYSRAKRILGEHREAVERVVARLLEKETLSGEELEDILRQAGVELPEQVPFPWSEGEWPPRHPGPQGREAS